jgi:hypothetical protein
VAEVEIHEEKVFVHLDEKERGTGTWVLDTGVTNHMFGCRVPSGVHEDRHDGARHCAFW